MNADRRGSAQACIRVYPRSSAADLSCLSHYLIAYSRCFIFHISFFIFHQQGFLFCLLRTAYCLLARDDRRADTHQFGEVFRIDSLNSAQAANRLDQLISGYETVFRVSNGPSRQVCGGLK